MSPHPLMRAARAATSLVVRLALLLVVIEGTASLVGFALALSEGLQPAERERLHMRYDADLGWSSVPDTHLENFYGPGRNLTINSQGVRGKRTYAPRPPEGRLRALCAGDAYTLGTGVDDDSTWCAQLEKHEPRFETVNLGQGGYGLDQSYLRVRRDGVELGFDVLLFSFVRDDFARMEKDSYHHYAKPMLRVDANGELVVRNVPVPNDGERMPWLVRNLSLFERLKVVELARPVVRALRPTASGLTAGELSDLSGKVFEALAHLCDERSATLVLLYLPTIADYEQPGELWRERIAREARTRDIVFIDLVEDLRGLTRNDVLRLYESADDPGRAWEAALSEVGHAWVAERVLAHLRELPRFAPSAAPTSSRAPDRGARATMRGQEPT
jgi:hypothetical protein